MSEVERLVGVANRLTAERNEARDECARLRAVVEAARKDTTGCWNPWPGTGPDGGPVDHDCGVCPGCVLADALAKLDNLEGPNE